jgi:hypothetical protein
MDLRKTRVAMVKKSVASSTPSQPLSRPPKPTTSSASEMLTSSEIERLRRVQREQLAYARKAFRKNPPKA